MATLSKNILPIPESIVVGSGSYTVPSNKYALFSGSGFASALAISGSQSVTPSTPSMGYATQAWISAGSTISTSVSSTNTTTNLGFNRYSAFGVININGQAVINARVRMGWYSNVADITSEASVGWCISLFPIPVDNLPASLIT